MTRVITPVGRAAYPFLTEARPNMNQTENLYSIQIIFDETTNLRVLEDAVDTIIKEKHPNGAPANLRRPFRSGSEKADKDGYAETDTFLVCKRKEKYGAPKICDQLRNEIPATDIYGGCKVRLGLRPYYYGSEKGGSPGVAFGLEAVQFAGDGERIGLAPADPQEIFDDLPVEESANDLL